MTFPGFLIDESLKTSGLRFAVIWGKSLKTVAGPERLPDELAGLIAKIQREQKAPWVEGVRADVRNMLRYGKYKPTGRGKPASEFLLGAALDGTFPNLNVPANINNFISLSSGLPVSVFDADRMGPQALIRRGQPGESYVFNPSGQQIDLQDLLCVCRRDGDAWVPTGNPVKDAMATKIASDTKNVVAVIYAPISFPVDVLESLSGNFACLLQVWGGAAYVESATITP